jgi:hypothetical protein
LKTQLARLRPDKDAPKGALSLRSADQFDVTFLNGKKSNQKKPPLPRFFLRVATSDGARGNSLRSNRSARFSRPPCRCSARDKRELRHVLIRLDQSRPESSQLFERPPEMLIWAS